MPRTERTRQEKLLQQLRTHSLLAHAMKCAGFFSKPEEPINLSELVTRLTRAQGESCVRGVRNSSHDLAEDAFSERRIERWIRGEVAAGRNLDRVLAAWDQGTFKGAIKAYRNGPTGSRLFHGLGEPIDSEAFFATTETTWDELARLGAPRGLSDNVADKLKKLRDETSQNEPEQVMHYATVTTAWFRYALMTIHSMDYLVWHVNEVLRRVQSISKLVNVRSKGEIVYPLSTALLSNYLVALTVGSARYRNKLADMDQPGRMPSWESVAQQIAADPQDYPLRSLHSWRGGLTSMKKAKEALISE